jgi:hypothetical protein
MAAKLERALCATLLHLFASYGSGNFPPIRKVHVRLEVFTAVTMKNAVFWDVTR